MLAPLRSLVATVLALLLFASAGVAIAATGSVLYRTQDQAAHYLTHRLHRWAGIDLDKFSSKSAYCAGAGHGRVNEDGVLAYRSFSCVLNVRIKPGKNGTRVFQLDLVKVRHGWRLASDRG
jgi:hypothetical protein